MRSEGYLTIETTVVITARKRNNDDKKEEQGILCGVFGPCRRAYNILIMVMSVVISFVVDLH